MKIYKQGMTVVEVLVGVALLSVACCAVLGAILNCIVLTNSSVNLTTAVNDAQYVLEQVKSLDYASIPAYTSPVFTNLPNESITLTKSIGASISRITVNVNWQEFKNARTLSLSTDIAQ